MTEVFKRKINRVLDNPAYLFWLFAKKGFFNWMDDETYIKMLYKALLGDNLNLNNPITFNEKLQWLKLYNRNSTYTKMVDKYLAKDFIKNVVGEKYVVPTYAVWNNAEDIDVANLPDQFVIKCNHDSKGLVICTDKKHFDVKHAKKKLQKCLNRNFYYLAREWPYKDVKPVILAEQYLSDGTDCLTDYKFFCFNGEPKIMYISQDYGDNPHTDFFDMDFNHLDLHMADPNSKEPINKPNCFDEMRELAKKLSSGTPHLRVDFYYVNGQVYVGELTFFHNAGFQKIYPKEWAKKMGQWIELPPQNKANKMN